MASKPEVPSIKMIPIRDIAPNDYNPNVMSDDFFNMLTEDMGSDDLGFLQPILVRERGDGTFEIIDGEHRYEAARLKGFSEIPCVVARGALATDANLQKIQTVRMNKLRGQLDRRKFTDLVRGLAKEYTLDQLAQHMAFTDPSQLEALIGDARKTLPPEIRKEFDAAREEIKTVDDLSNVLNRLFTKYGNTLDHRFMVLDFGGQKHIWIRFPDKRAYDEVMAVADLCVEHGATMDDVVLAAIRGIDASFFGTGDDQQPLEG